MPDDTTARRKDAHLDVCATEEVEPRANRTLLDQVHLVHCALPELSLDEVDLSTEWLGKRLRWPLVITGMTGGTERAGRVNADLASLAERYGLAFGVGSQRAMSEQPERAASFQVREAAPTALLLGNVGLRRAAELGPDGARRLCDAIGADGLALHLNAGQELTQPEGDRDFRGGYATVEVLARVFGDRLVVKETGCGIGPAEARRLVSAGARNLDLSGLGGTSWIRVEELRAQGLDADVGAQFAGWGIPTAAAVASVRRAVGPTVRLVASGGIRSGLDIAKAICLGADLGGMALPLFRAHQSGGTAAAEKVLQTVMRALQHAFLLTGSRTAADLQRRRPVVTGELKDWVAALDAHEEGPGRHV